MHVARVVLIGLGIVGSSAIANAAQADRALEVSALGNVALRIDGDLREWRGARFVALGADAGASLEYALAYDTDAIYVGARVADDDLVRTSEPSPAEDALVLTLALPTEHGRPTRSDVWLYAGVSGRQRASAAIAVGPVAPKANAAITIAEGPLTGHKGYVIEARVPWSAIAGGRDAMLARAALALHDVDGRAGSKPVVVATAHADVLPPLVIEGGPHAAIAAFLRAKELTNLDIRFDLMGDVLGDERLERVVLAGSFVVVAGPDLRGGDGFHYMDLPIASAESLLEAQLRDLTWDGRGSTRDGKATRDGKEELVVRMRQSAESRPRELFQVIDLSAEQPRPLLTIETRREGEGGGYVAADLRVGNPRAGKPPPIEARIGSARGLDAETDRAQTSPGIEPLLTPWGAWTRRVYQWDGSSFAVVEQQANPNAVTTIAAPRVDAQHKPADGAASPTAHAAPPGAAELIAAFRSARGIDPGLNPSFTQYANFAEDSALESLQILGTDLLLLGKGYRGGTGYFFFGLPVHAAADIEHVFTGDVTGDGRRELFVRIRQVVGDVQRDILLGYTFTDGGMDPILAVEVRRNQGERSVGTRVTLVEENTAKDAPRSRRRALRITSGHAQGWDAGTYPFVAESHDAYEALLLPWNERERRYRYESGQLVASPAPPNTTSP